MIETLVSCGKCGIDLALDSDTTCACGIIWRAAPIFSERERQVIAEFDVGQLGDVLGDMP